MYARMIQLSAKSGRGQELRKTMMERTLPILKQQPGFVDAIALSPENEHDQFVGISIWKNKSDADKYVQTRGQQDVESYRPLLQSEPAFRSFNVEESTFHESSSRAASR